MKNSKLISILKSLNKEEFKRLGWFVKSDFFNTDENLVRLFAYLKKYHPAFSSKGLQKETAFGHVFPSTKYSDAKMRNLMSKMVGLLEKYLVELELEQNKVKRRIILSESLKNRGLNNECKLETKAIIDVLKKSSYRDEEHYSQMSILHKNLYFNPSNTNRKEMGKTLEAAHHSLDNFYHIAQTKIEGELNAIKSFYETTSFRLKENLIGENILYMLMNKISELYKKGEEKKFFEIKKLLFENQNEIRIDEQKFILKHLIGYAIRQSSKSGNYSKYSAEIFELYKLSHENNLIAVNGKISTTSFLNILAISARVKEITWANKFIQENEKKLDGKSRKEIKALGLAYIAFYSENYSDVLFHVSMLKFINVLYEVNAKTLSLKSYFELFTSDSSYYDLIISYSNSFEKYVKRHSNIGKNKSSSIVYFIRSIKKIAYLLQQNDFKEEKRNGLLTEIKSYSSIIERGWLISKIKK